jgi:hypothetical protein
VHVPEQQVEGHREEGPFGCLKQFEDAAQADKSGVGQHIRRRGGGVARHVRLAQHEAEAEAGGDPVEQVEDSETARCRG